MTIITEEWGCSDDKYKSNPKHIRIQTIFGNCCCTDSAPMQIIVISGYRPSSTPTDVFINGMLEVIAQFQNVPICVVGDLNEDVSIHQIPTVVQCLNYKACNK